MPSTFLGIEIGSTGLSAAQLGQDVVGHNIANAGTEGYSVQRSDQRAQDPFTVISGSDHVHAGMIGTGVTVGSINRARDQFLDAQVRGSLSQQSMASQQSGSLGQIEGAFNEPSDNGLNAAMGKFFQSFNELANNPEDKGVRATVVQDGQAMARVFHQTQATLDAVGTQLATRQADDESALNAYSQQISQLNVSIRLEVSQKQQPNDLMDQRDLLIDKVAKLANISVLNNSDGTVNVSVGTTDLVIGTDAYSVTAAQMTAKGDLTGGEMAGVASVQTDLQGFQTHLDNLAKAVKSLVNTQNQAGLDLNGQPGAAFFTGTDARTLSVTAALLSDPSGIAAASVPTPPAAFAVGDGSNAVRLAALQTGTINVAASDPASALNGTNLTSFYQQTVSDAGGKSAAAKTALANATSITTQMTQQRASVTGVSSDQEMANMMKYQRAYEASARVVKTMDDMLGTLINGLFAN